MPVYEHECEACRNVVDAIRTVDERKAFDPCEFCGTATHVRLNISACMGIVDFPAAGGREYVSTTTGRVISSARQRKDDLKRSGCRPYEGFEQETKEANRRKAYEDKKADEKLHDAVATAYHQLPPEKRRVLETPLPA